MIAEGYAAKQEKQPTICKSGPQPIRITKADNGYIVHFDFATHVFESTESMMAFVGKYFSS